MTDRTSAPPTDQGTDRRATDALRQIAEAEAELADLRARLAPYASGVDDTDGHLYGQDPDYIETLVRELPKDLTRQIHVTMTDARPLAWLMLELVQRHRQLWDRLIDFYWRDTEKTSEGGHLLNAIAVESGLGVVDDVLGGLAEVITGGSRMSSQSRTATAMRRHAADHYREVGTPAVVSAIDEDES